MQAAGFTPAAGYSALTPVYDIALRVLTREARWRNALLDQIDLRDHESILDVGCGTGTLAIMLKLRVPDARVIGLDPDPTVLQVAAAKARRAGAHVEWRLGFAQDAPSIGQVDQVVSTLVFHQVSLGGKRAGLRAMFEAVRPGGAIHLADYCRQPDWVARQLFRFIQMLDGQADTQANLEGAVERTLEDLSGKPANPRAIVRTLTGAISLFHVQKGDA